MAHEWWATGATLWRYQGTLRVLGWISVWVFVVPGVLYVAHHISHWPGGYLLWMLSLGFLLAALVGASIGESGFVTALLPETKRDRRSR